MLVTGSTMLARAQAREGTEAIFFLMGAPILDAAKACAAAGIRMIDVRHEQAGAMMAHAHARVLARPAVCMAGSGPGTINLSTGLANALIDGAPVIALGGSSPIADVDTGAFQEIDQFAVMRPVTKWVERVHEARRITEYVHRAFGRAMTGKPGPVYLDLPGDVLHQEVEATAVAWPDVPRIGSLSRPAATPDALDRLVSMLRQATRPIIVAGSGALWSQAADELQCLVAAAGIPFYTTPPARGLGPGPFGTLGVGLPFALDAKAAKPDKQVIVLSGDGSFGLNALELDTAIRHKLPVLVVISLNGGWTADVNDQRAGRELGDTRYDKLAESLGCRGEFVNQPDEIRPALERAARAMGSGQTAVVNVVTDSRARARTAPYARYAT